LKTLLAHQTETLLHVYLCYLFLILAKLHDRMLKKQDQIKHGLLGHLCWQFVLFLLDYYTET